MHIRVLKSSVTEQGFLLLVFVFVFTEQFLKAGCEVLRR